MLLRRRWKPLVVSAVVGLTLVFALFLPVLAQPGADDGPPKGRPAAAPTEKGAPESGDVGVQGGLVPDYVRTFYTARGAHAGETATYALAIINTGGANGNATEVTAPLPVNASYLNGSAAVQGGGTLTVVGGLLTWQGVVPANNAVTITYQVKLPNTVGAVVNANATIYDPGLPQAVHRFTELTIQAPSLGPDDFGYTVKDSFAPGGPTYTWVPTTTPASKLDFGPPANDDDAAGPFNLGFSFNFYGNVYTQTYVSTNGMLNFSEAETDNQPNPVPHADESNNFIGCFWGDLYETNLGQGAWLETYGSAPNRTAVITFRLAYFSTSADPNTPPALWQVILSETTNTIKCQYAANPGPNNASGGGATIEIENLNGDAGLAYFYSDDGRNASDFELPAIIGPIEPGLAVQFTPNGLSRPNFSTSTLIASHNVHPGDTLTYTLIVSNSGNAPASSATVVNPIPANTSYVGGSAAVQGGGALAPSASTINWSGSIAAGARLTITYRVQLAATLGLTITNQATLNDGNLAHPVVVTNNRVGILPTTSGGPDTFNYTFKDSYAPGGPTFGWVPTTTAGSKLAFPTPADDFVITNPVPISFTFQFYGQPYTQIKVSSNGLVFFGPGSTTNNPQPIPTNGVDSEADNYAACFWSDLVIQTPAQGIWVETSGSPGTRRAVITFYETAFTEESLAPALFQMILAEADNSIKCQYAAMPDRDSTSGGRQTTIGVENADGTSGLQYFHASDWTDFKPIMGPLENNLAVLFKPGTLPPSLSASVKQSTVAMHPGEAIAYTIVIHNNSSVAANAATLNDPIPAGATYVGGSAAVSGGGTVNGSSSAITWSGSVAPGASVTVTFSLLLPAVIPPSGEFVNTATLNDAAAVVPVVVSAHMPMQPTFGLGVGPRFYQYHDNYGPGVGFSWVPTTSPASKVPILTGDNDDGYGQVNLPFTFDYFGHAFTSVYVSTNGLVMFNSAPETDALDDPIPSPFSIDNYATCLGMDLQASDPSQGMWAELFGSGPNRTMVITFRLADYDNPSDLYLFQMILAESRNTLTCQYLSVEGTGHQATIGAEGPDGLTGVQYFYRDEEAVPVVGPVENNLAIRFEPASVDFLPLVNR